MTQTADCPNIVDLWPAAVGEFVVPDVHSHLQRCRDCTMRVEELVREIESVRRLNRSIEGQSHCEIPDVWRTRTGVSSLPTPLITKAGETLRLPMIGKYPVLETLSDGGQATVYRGLHPSLLIEVAIKWSHVRHGSSKVHQARLASEAKLLAALRHPNLARVYDLDSVDDRPFLVMELIRGEHLRSYRERVTISLEQAVRIVAAVARAIETAHRHWILHLDLKPENVMIDGDREPILIDFGLSFLSRVVVETAQPAQFLGGTPEYMAPEQTCGTVVELSPRTDVFGLGAVLYFLCTGAAPCSTENLDSNHRRDPVEPEWSRLERTAASRQVKCICRRAMAAVPDERYESAGEMAAVLEDEAQRLAKSCSLKRLTAILMAIIGVLAVMTAAILPTARDNHSHRGIDISLLRVGHELPIAAALPLQTGDRIRFEACIDGPMHVALGNVGPGQPAWCRPLSITRHADEIRVGFPRANGFIRYDSPDGPQVMVLLLRSNGPILERDNDLLTNLPDCPPIPLDCAVSFSDTGSSIIGQMHAEALPAVELWLDDVRRLLNRHCDGYRGMILPASHSGDATDWESTAVAATRVLE